MVTDFSIVGAGRNWITFLIAETIDLIAFSFCVRPKAEGRRLDQFGIKSELF
jgi:hypothetical protein